MDAGHQPNGCRPSRPKWAALCAGPGDMDNDAASADGARASQGRSIRIVRGWIVALLAVIPVRRRTLAAMRIRKNTSEIRSDLVLDIPARDTKTRRSLGIRRRRSCRKVSDLYVTQFRCRIYWSNAHEAFGPHERDTTQAREQVQHCPAGTKPSFGIPGSQFAPSSATRRDLLVKAGLPERVRGAKDLRGQASSQTEKIAHPGRLDAVLSASRIPEELEEGHRGARAEIDLIERR